VLTLLKITIRKGKDMPFTKNTVHRLNPYFPIICFCIVALFAGCSKKSNPTSFIDGYNVNLTEAKGTSYSGDYFPIREGYTCNYQGSVSMRVTASIPGEGNHDTTMNSSAAGMLKVLPVRSIMVNGNSLSLYPIIDMSTMMGDATYDTSRFFMKNDSAVYIKAIKLSNGSFSEVKNPIYIKSTLVVGDSWETTPEMDVAQLMQNQGLGDISMPNINFNAQAKFFVIGKEQITVPIGTKQAIRMDQANEITLSGSMVSDSIPGGSISISANAKLTAVYHLVKDTGMIRQNITGPMNINVKMMGMDVTAAITFDRFELGLTSLGTYAVSSTAPLVKCTIKRDNSSLSSLPVEQKLIKISEALQYGLISSLKF
jgi:hypothetical protein